MGWMFRRHPSLILIGTHHKAGTHWLAGIFRAIAEKHFLGLYEGPQLADLSRYDLFFQDHSDFTLNTLKNYRGLHMVRDPRDIIVSGCFYHQRAEESWMHIPRKRYEGLSYVQRINSFDTVQEQLLFEMEHIGLLTLRDMYSWNYRNKHFLEVQYENLIDDRELTEFRKVFTFLQKDNSVLAQFHIDDLLQLAHDNSLFSGKVNDGGHVRSGEASQWREHFDTKLSQRFVELFGDLLIRLGYEQDHSWAGLDKPPAGPPQCEALTIFDVLYHPQDIEYKVEVKAGRRPLEP